MNLGLLKSFKLSLAAPLCLALLSGCGSMSGIGGTSAYSCKAPAGVHCNSLTGNFYNAGKIAPVGSPASSGRQSPMASVPRSTAAVLQPAGVPLKATALRAEGRVLRLWIKPWEDADNDLIDQSFVYLQVERPRWQVAHVQRAARDPYAPLQPDRPAGAAGTLPESPGPAVVGPVSGAPATGATTPETNAVFDPGLGLGEKAIAPNPAK